MKTNDATGELQRRLEALGQVLRSHAGGVEIVSHDEDGGLVLRLTGACTGCMVKAVTAETLVIPTLEDLPEVSRVEIVGARVHQAVKERLLRMRNDPVIRAIKGESDG